MLPAPGAREDAYKDVFDGFGFASVLVDDAALRAQEK